ncbi:MAG: TetR/AcrR family transcriptional regulator [Saprospiraceae bacterium]|nr:TetR/AcrR family transcriptional regulator [Saprospiraceae bacterium]MCB9325194.1 TetR/AcrR family transcriptional regulator [Lewinellaceae bacterium]
MSEKQQTELVIKEAARQVFLRKGFSGARMQDIADNAGINKALLHYYYRSKEKLFDVIFMEQFSELIGQLKQGLDSGLDLFEKIEFFIDKYISVLEKNPYLPLFVINEISKDQERFIGRIKKFDAFPEAAAMVGMMLQAMEDGKIKRYHPFHLLMNIISMSVFPFLAKPMLISISGISEADWKELMKERKEEVKRFVFSALSV